MRRKGQSAAVTPRARQAVGRRSDHPLEHDAVASPMRSCASLNPRFGGCARPHTAPATIAHEMKERATEDWLSEAPPVVNEVLREQGRPLDPTTRAFFESRFGHDFGRVRIHADSLAASAAQSVCANAFTSGRTSCSVPVATSRSEAGQHLLAHELAHVVQQGGKPSHAILRRDGPDPPSRSEEGRCDRAVSDGLKTVAAEAVKNDAFKNYGLALRSATRCRSGME